MNGTVTATLDHDKALGMSVNQVMFAQHVTRKELGDAIGVSHATMSRKLNGHVAWTVEELNLVAAYLHVKAVDLLPTMDGFGGWIPAPFNPENTKTPAFAGAISEPPVGIEPTTYSLKGRNHGGHSVADTSPI